MVQAYVRRCVRRLLTGEKGVALENRVPSREELRDKFEDIDELGLYLHIPFCRQICPYCPYNKELYRPEVARRYARAVVKEIDFYADIVGKRPVTSFYIGGGSPTTMLEDGLEDVVEHIFDVFGKAADVHAIGGHNSSDC